MGELDFTQIQQMGKADTWAIGVILYFLLLGNLPFVGSNVSKLVKTVKKGKIKKVDQKEWCSDLKSLWDLITKLILNDPGQRMSAAEALTHPFIQNELHREDKTLKQKYAKKLKDSIHNLLIMDEISNYTSFL